MDPKEFEYRVERAHRKAMGLPVGKDIYSLGSSGCLILVAVPVVLFILIIVVVTASLRNAENAVSEKESGPQIVEDGPRGIRISVPADWEEQPQTFDGRTSITYGEHSCGQETCVRASIKVWDVDSYSDVISAARGEVKKQAERSYEGMTKHAEVKAGPVDVAGADAYLVRWKVDDSPDSGYVQIAAYPMRGDQIGIISVVVDDSPEAPKPAFMDEVISDVTRLS
ncbi:MULTISPECIES: hypothetical protein [unclassified Streptomyces]|uniref:hypothetical protein n=1 Tax=unclassified Streptomyces TaxID=2593676 RepID=UPI0035D55ECB